MFRRPLRRVWWLHPAVALGVPTMIVAVSAWLISPESYFIYWRTGKFVDEADVLMALAAVVAFTVGVFTGKARRPQEATEPGRSWTKTIPWDSVRMLFNICFWLTIFGYILWTGIALHNGLTLGRAIDALRGQNGATYDVRANYLVPVAGVSSFSQFGMAAIAFGIPLGIAMGWRDVRWKLITIIGLGLFRATINSERLAAIELLVPCTISYIWHRSARSSGRSPCRRWLLQTLPIAAVTVVFTLFSISEYQRSWLGFYSAHETNFLRFAALRFTGYYTTAFNNGTLFLHSAKPIGSPYFTAVFARHFPLVNSVVDEVLPVSYDGQEVYTNLLISLANPELNNSSGICVPGVDFGAAGALIYWLICGFACGYIYMSFIRFSPAGMFLYPVLFTSLLETPRILYWADGRAFPSLFIIVLSTLFVLNRPRIRFAARVPVLS